jgi:hypothetical protein
VKRSLTPSLNRPDSSPRARSGRLVVARGRGITPSISETTPPALELFACGHIPGWLHEPVVSLDFTTEETGKLLVMPFAVTARVCIDRASLHCLPGTVGGTPVNRNAPLSLPAVATVAGTSCRLEWHVPNKKVVEGDRIGSC